MAGGEGPGWGSSARRAHGNNFETRARLESEVLGGARVRARAGCGKWRLRNERPPAALVFVRSRAASFRALQWVRGGLSGLSSDKAESGSGSSDRDVDCLRGGVKVFSALGALREGGGRRPPGRVRREQPPSLNNSPAVPGLAVEEASPRAVGEETESEGTARRGDDGRPPRLPGNTVCAAAPEAMRTNKSCGRGWPVAGSSRVPGVVGAWCCGFTALGLEVLRVWRSSGSARRVVPAARAGSVSSPLSAGARHFKADRLFYLRLWSAPLSCPFGDGQESPWRLFNLCAPSVTSGFLPGVTPPAEWSLRLGSPQGLQRAPSGPSPGTSWVGGGSALPGADVRVRFPPR